MIPRRFPADARIRMDFREGVIVGVLLPRIDARGVALFEVDRAENMAAVFTLDGSLSRSEESSLVLRAKYSHFRSSLQ